MDAPARFLHPAATPAGPAAGVSLINYPCQFPIKVMCLTSDTLIAAITAVARSFDPDFDSASIELRPSKTGKYLGLTLIINATSRQQLDDLYQALFQHPMVKVVL